MTDAHGREPRRQVWHFALVILFGFAVIASELLARRPLLYGAFNNVAPAGVAPASMAPDDWSLIVHRSDWNPPVAALLGHARADRPARIGWTVREWSLLSLPLIGWRQSDLAVFREDAYGYRMAGLTDGQRVALARTDAVGRFPWWRYIWGWLPLAALASFVRAELGWQARRRALLGIM